MNFFALLVVYLKFEFVRTDQTTCIKSRIVILVRKYNTS